MTQVCDDHGEVDVACSSPRGLSFKGALQDRVLHGTPGCQDQVAAEPRGPSPKGARTTQTVRREDWTPSRWKHCDTVNGSCTTCEWLNGWLQVQGQGSRQTPEGSVHEARVTVGSLLGQNSCAFPGECAHPEISLSPLEHQLEHQCSISRQNRSYKAPVGSQSSVIPASIRDRSQSASRIIFGTPWGRVGYIYEGGSQK